MTQKLHSQYFPLNDYAIIGDSHTAALVARDGSIDWCCWPDFDSPAVFCRILDSQRGGYFRIGPTSGNYSCSRSYDGLTNVLQTTFETDGGRARLTDLMPVNPKDNERGEDVASGYEILRLIEGVNGSVEMEIVFRPTFDYGRGDTTLSICDEGALAKANSEGLALYCPLAL